MATESRSYLESRRWCPETEQTLFRKLVGQPRAQKGVSYPMQVWVLVADAINTEHKPVPPFTPTAVQGRYHLARKCHEIYIDLVRRPGFEWNGTKFIATEHNWDLYLDKHPEAKRFRNGVPANQTLFNTFFTVGRTLDVEEAEDEDEEMEGSLDGDVSTRSATTDNDSGGSGSTVGRFNAVDAGMTPLWGQVADGADGEDGGFTPRWGQTLGEGQTPVWSGGGSDWDNLPRVPTPAGFSATNLELDQYLTDQADQADAVGGGHQQHAGGPDRAINDPPLSSDHIPATGPPLTPVSSSIPGASYANTPVPRPTALTPVVNPRTISTNTPAPRSTARTPVVDPRAVSINTPVPRSTTRTPVVDSPRAGSVHGYGPPPLHAPTPRRVSGLSYADTRACVLGPTPGIGPIPGIVLPDYGPDVLPPLPPAPTPRHARLPGTISNLSLPPPITQPARLPGTIPNLSLPPPLTQLARLPGTIPNLSLPPPVIQPPAASQRQYGESSRASTVETRKASGGVMPPGMYASQKSVGADGVPRTFAWHVPPMTRSESAIRYLQDNYTDRLSQEDMVWAWEVMEDEVKARVFLCTQEGRTRDAWLVKQIEKIKQTKQGSPLEADS